jgi:hypothetical protein
MFTATDDVFQVIERCGVSPANHIKFLLKELGYNSVGALKRIEKDEMPRLLESIKAIFLDDDLLIDMSDEDKLKYFGPLFCKRPKSFRFLPGDIASIEAVVDICKEIVQNNKIPFLQCHNSVFQYAQKPPKSNAIKKQHNVPSKCLAITADGENPESLAKTGTTRANNKNLSQYVQNWFEKQGDKYDLSFSDCNIDDNSLVIECRKCNLLKPKHDVRVSIHVDVEGYFKISNFTRHVANVSYHLQFS